MSDKILGGTEDSGIDDSFPFFMKGCKFSGIQSSKSGEALGGGGVNEIREHGVNLIEDIWPHGMMLTGRVSTGKEHEGCSGDTSEVRFRHLTSYEESSFATDGLHNCAGQLPRGHAFSWPWLLTAACHLASHQPGDTTK